jgi:molecular chaperone DnaK (HSP70)
MTAARDAGLNVLQVINEPTAAVSAYDTIDGKNKKTDKTVVVLDLGARSLDVNLLSAKKGLYTVLATIHDNTIGGVKFDQLLVDHFSKEFQKKTKVDISSNTKALTKLTNACDLTKRTLTSLITAPCFVESLAEGLDFHSTINRTRFEIMSAKLFNQVLSVVSALLEKSDYKSYEIDEVVLVGGASRIPKLGRKLSELFEHDDFEVRTQLETDEVIPLGCVLQAATLSQLNHGEDVSLEQLHENSHLINVNYTVAPIGLVGGDDQFVTLIGKDTPLPVRRVFPLAIAEGSKSAFVSVYEAVEDSKTIQPETPPQDPEDDEEPEVPEPITTFFYKANTLLAELGLKDLDTPNLQLQIEVDEQGKLDITLSDLKSGSFSQVTSA